LQPILDWLVELLWPIIESFTDISLGNVVMMAIGGLMIYLAVKKDYEPMLLLPMGFGAILANMPLSMVVGEHGFLTVLYEAGIATELFPVLIFIAVGAMVDFTPLLEQPSLIFFGAAAQFGIFLTMIFATMLGFDIFNSAAIGIIGAADGPTSIYVANRFAQDLIGPISVAAYSYMALVPVIQPFVIKLITTKEDRRIRMESRPSTVSPLTRILFPIIVTIVVGLIAPMGVALVGALMYGNLLRECGVLKKLSDAAQNELSNLVTVLLGLTIGGTMVAERFLTPATLMIMGLGLVAFVFDTVGGVLFAKFINLFVKRKYNPMIGAAGISAFPMSARVIHKLAQKEDPSNFILMQAVGANVAGQVGSIVAGGVIINLLAKLMEAGI
jgi:sodium ion-translocating decarboxylase beta subunit